MWSAACERAFQLVKKSASVLAFYDLRLPLRVASDASAYGNRCCIDTNYASGSGTAGCFASHTMTSVGRNYSQLEQEALAII